MFAKCVSHIRMRVTQLHSDKNNLTLPSIFFCTFAIRQENVFLLLQFLNSSSFTPHYCVHIPLQSAIHQKWHEPAHFQRERRVPFQNVRDRMIKVLKVSSRCYNKTVSQQSGLGLHHHWLVLWWFLNICRRVLHLHLVVVRLPSCRLCWSTVYADLLVLGQLLSEWGLTHPAFGPLFPHRGPWIGELFVGSSWRCRPVKDISPGLL